MLIVRRHKNINNIIIGYTIELDGNCSTYMDTEDVIKLYEEGKITNAVLTTNGFRAKNGYRIKTVMCTSVISPTELGYSTEDIINSILGIDCYGSKFIKECKKIRQFALSNKIIVDKSKYFYNKGWAYLFNLIEACGLELETFIKGYLSVLQPYSLVYFIKERHGNGNIWYVDMGYGVCMVLRVGGNGVDKPIAVSFYENNTGGIFKLGKINFSDRPCTVITDRVTPFAGEVEFSVQSNYVYYRVEDMASYLFDNVALVSYSKIREKFNILMQSTLRRLTEKYHKIYKEYSLSIPVSFTDLISKSQNSQNIVNTLCFLIEIFQLESNEVRLLLVEMVNSIVLAIPDTCINEILLDLVDGHRDFLDSKNALSECLVSYLEDRQAGHISYKQRI